MNRAGYVLAGGRSSRMGRDKALLEVAGLRLIESVARAVERAAASVTLIGDPARYRGLGYPVTPDLLPGCGPLGGIYTALADSAADWNLILACDMPDVQPEMLAALLREAAGRDADCLLPVGASGLPEPLCGVYHRRVQPAIRRALDGGIRKITDGLAGLRLELLPVETGQLRNINTPQDWSEYTSAQTDKTRGGRF